MKVAFINDVDQNIGVEYLAAVLKKHGHQAKLFLDPRVFRDSDLNIPLLARFFSEEQRIINAIEAYAPGLIGFSVLSDSYEWACDLAAKLKKRLPHVPIIFGGIHPSSVPEHVIKNDYIDMVCVGEGEFALLELVEKLELGDIDCLVRNIWFKKDGAIVKNPPRPLIEDLDGLPFSDKMLFFEAGTMFRSRQINIITGRGCNFSCTYCYNSVLKEIYKNEPRYLRRRSVGNVIDEIVELGKQRIIKRVCFVDDNFINDKQWLSEFSARYARIVNLPFGCNIHPLDVDEEKLVLLKKAGCRDVEIGIQTWSESVRRNALNRFESNAQIEKAITLLNKYRIRIATDTIFGIPGQSEEEILQQALFLNNNRTHVNNIFFMKFFPKTRINQVAVAAGVLTKEDVEKREQGVGCSSYSFARGGDILNKHLLQLRLLFTLLPFLPKRVNTFLIKKKLYACCLPLPLNFARIVNIFSGRVSAYGVFTLEAKAKTYFYYIMKRLFGVWGLFSRKG